MDSPKVPQGLLDGELLVQRDFLEVMKKRARLKLKRFIVKDHIFAKCRVRVPHETTSKLRLFYEHRIIGEDVI
jgi:hypothetical protein